SVGEVGAMQVSAGEISPRQVSLGQVEALEVGAGEIAAGAIPDMPGQEFSRVARPAGSPGHKQKSEDGDRPSRDDQRLHGGPPLSFFTRTGKVLVLAAALASGGFGAAAADPAVYSGAAEVIGPAMLNLNGKRILLFGVDAPVKGQPCYVGA